MEPTSPGLTMKEPVESSEDKASLQSRPCSSRCVQAQPGDQWAVDEGDLLTALRQQQTRHEQRVQQMLKEQLDLISTVLAEAVGCERLESSEPETLEPPKPVVPEAAPKTGLSQQTTIGFQESPTAGTENLEPMVRANRTVAEKEQIAKPGWNQPNLQSEAGWERTMVNVDETQLFGVGKSSTSQRRLHRTSIKRIAQVIERSYYFHFAMEVIIFANAAMVGIEQDTLARNLESRLGFEYLVVDGCFATAFIFELLVRVTAGGWAFFNWNTKDAPWNYFDTFLVLCATVEIVFKFSDAHAFIDMSAGRVLRTMRLVRVVRMVRVLRFFKDLRIMVLSIMGSMKPLIFALFLLGGLIYVVSVCFMHLITDELVRLSQMDGGTNSPQFRNLSLWYGTLDRTFYTMFLSVTNGVSWGVVCEPLWDISWLLGLCYMLYVCFAIFCVLNIITAIFIEEATNKTCQDEEQMLIREMDKRKRFIEEAKRFFREANKDGSGIMTLAEFEECLRDLRMQKLLDNLGIDVVSCGADNVFQLFDFNSDGGIEIPEFNAGLQRLRGGARSIEIAGMRFEQQQLILEVEKLKKLMEGVQEHIKKKDPPHRHSLVGSRLTAKPAAVRL